MTQIAFLGTGLLGSAFVEAAIGRGDSVTVWNRTPAKARALEPLGASVAASPADAVRDAERVHLVLRDDAVVDDVIEQFRMVLPASCVIVDHTTTQPALTAARAQRLADHGVRYLHCPVFIGPAAARQGKGTILAAGPVDIYVDVQRALERMAEHVRFVGERPDLAAAHKLMGNCYILGLAALVSDVMAIGRGADVSPSDALELLGTFNAAGIIAGRGRKMAQGDFEASFELDMARKDIRLMMETAGDFPLAILPSLAARMDHVLGEGLGDKDFSVIAHDMVEHDAQD
jgi:3-hydroxyisobutyrate dehydrogenase-like beta-hydroxyacid dehydrogenase